MLSQPEAEWQTVREEKINGLELFRNYLVPLSAAGSACTFILQLWSNMLLYAFATALITFVASVVGTYITYRVTKEYLLNKIDSAGKIALHLSIYCSGVFIIFHCLAEGMSGGFLGQLMAVFSLLCLRTLYLGLGQITGLNSQYRKSAIIIIGALVILSPVIIQRLLMIIFRIPTIYA